MSGRKKPLPVAVVMLTQLQIEGMLSTRVWLDESRAILSKPQEDAYAALERALVRLEERTGTTRCPCGGRMYTDTARLLKHNLSERHQEYLRFSGKAPSIGKVTE